MRISQTHCAGREVCALAILDRERRRDLPAAKQHVGDLIAAHLNVRDLPKGRSYAPDNLKTFGWSNPYGLRCGTRRYWFIQPHCSICRDLT
jgi:hypothetical protein